jgi:uncharacterized coiled-coil protein SlyX
MSQDKIDGLELVIADQAEQIEKLSEELKALQAEVAQMKEGLASTTAKKAVEKKVELPAQAFKVGGKEYKFKVASFRMPTLGKAKKMLAQDTLKDKELLKTIVEEYPSLVEKQ